MRTRILTVLLIASLLTACASTPSVPYWENQQWVNALGLELQKDIQYPQSLAQYAYPLQDAYVQFTYDQGHLVDIKIVRSSGYPALDSFIKAQIRYIKTPPIKGSDSLIPHSFEYPVALNFSRDPFFKAFVEDIKSHKHEPPTARNLGWQGVVTVEFYYRDGKILNPSIAHKSHLVIFDQAALKDISSIKAPAAPPALRGVLLKMVVPMCYPFCAHYMIHVYRITNKTINVP